MERMQKRGHCQGCGRLQAANPAIAQHGYRVECGYFNGVCHGARRLPLEDSRDYLDDLVVAIAKRADQDDARALRLELRQEDPVEKIERKRVGWYANHQPRYEERRTPYAELREYEQQQLRASLVWRLRQDAKHGRSWIDMMQKLAAEVHGQPLQEVKVAAAAAPIREGEKRQQNGVLYEARRQEGGRVYYNYQGEDRAGRAWMGTQAWRRMPMVEAANG